MAKRTCTTFLNNDREMFKLLDNTADSEDNSAQKRLARRALKKIIDEQLTSRQKQFLVLYYYQGMDMPTIAKKHEVNVSTVSRTINRARMNIQKYMKYYFV